MTTIDLLSDMMNRLTYKDFFRKRYCLVTYDSIQLNKAENFKFAADFYDLYETE